MTQETKPLTEPFTEKDVRDFMNATKIVDKRLEEIAEFCWKDRDNPSYHTEKKYSRRRDWTTCYIVDGRIEITIEDQYDYDPDYKVLAYLPLEYLWTDYRTAHAEWVVKRDQRIKEAAEKRKAAAAAAAAAFGVEQAEWEQYKKLREKFEGRNENPDL